MSAPSGSGKFWFGKCNHSYKSYPYYTHLLKNAADSSIPAFH
jgi:hypothetical protein